MFKGLSLIPIVLTATAWGADPFLPTAVELESCKSEGALYYEKTDRAARPVREAKFEVQVSDRQFVVRDGVLLFARVYEPKGFDGPRRAILQIHGGGWMGGSRTDMPEFAHRMASLGAVVISPDYRLAPDHIFPAQPNDIAEALRWISRERLKLKVDPTWIGVFGFSAGANLAAYAAATFRPTQDEMPIGRVVTLAARVDLENDRGFGKDFVSPYLGIKPKGADSPLRKLASPAYRVLEHPEGMMHPSVLVVHELKDSVIHFTQACRYRKALLERGIGHDIMILPGTRATHGPALGTRQRLVFREAMVEYFDL